LDEFEVVKALYIRIKLSNKRYPVRAVEVYIIAIYKSLKMYAES
jgi:hypothetical protein